MTKNSALLLAFSYPRYSDDESSIFIKRLVQGYSKAGASGVLITPLDSREALQEQFENFLIVRYRYGIFSKGRLAFGSGIMPNIRSNPLLMLQVPMFLFMMYLSALRTRRQWSFIHANWAVAGLVALALRLSTGRPYIITLRGEDMNLLRRPIFRLILKPAFLMAQKVTSINQSFLDQLLGFYPGLQSKLEFIPNGVELEPVETERLDSVLHQYMIPAQQKNLLFIGTLIPRKQIEILVKALGLLPEYHLIVCGRTTDQDYMETLTQLTKDSACASRVHFVGAVAPKHIPYFLQAAFAYVSASAFEGRPNSVLEAMAARLPVVLSKIPAHQELIQDRQSGLLFDASDPEDLAEQIRYLEQQGRAELVSAAHLRVADLSWQGAAKSYLSCFNNEVF